MMNESRSRCLSAIVLVCILMLAGAPRVFAHSRPVTYDPAPDSSVAHPSAITIHFSEALEPKFSSLFIMGMDGGSVKTDKAVVDSTDPKKMTLTLPKLVPGEYMVHWVSVSKGDGHRLEGSYNFKVTE